MLHRAFAASQQQLSWRGPRRCNAPYARQKRPRSLNQVRILQGPFAGHLGLYAGQRAHERVLVLLALLGGQQRVELAKDDVESAR